VEFFGRINFMNEPIKTKTRVFKLLSFVLFVLAILHFLGVKFYLDWVYSWYDMVLHFLGGVAVGLFAIWVFEHISGYNLWTNIRILIWGLVMVLTVGVLWEIFEIYVGFTDFGDGMQYVTDTISDLVLDSVGGILGLIYGLKTRNE